MFRQHTLTLSLTIIAVGLSLIPVSAFDNQLSDMLKITLSVFAIARGLNAILSVAQGTELSIEPMGVGITLTPGQILDPLNDLIEQFSNVLLIASASLGIQQILVILSDKTVVQYGITLFILTLSIIIFLPHQSAKIRSKLLNVILLITLLRLLIPFTVFISYQVQSVLSEQRQEAVFVLENTRHEVEHFTQSQSHQETTSWWDGLKNTFDIEQGLKILQQKSEMAVEATVYLLAEFILVMVVLPILCLYLFLRLFNSILAH
jgi:hypothetical protein